MRPLSYHYCHFDIHEKLRIKVDCVEHSVSKRTATAWQLHGVKEKMSTITPKSPQTKDKPMRQWFGGMRQKG